MSRSKEYQQQTYQKIRTMLYTLFHELHDQGVGLHEFVILVLLALSDSFRAIAEEEYGVEYKSEY